MTTSAVLVAPSIFDPTQWLYEEPTPPGYTGIKFDFDLVARLIQPVQFSEVPAAYADRDFLRVLGTWLWVTNVQLTAPKDDPTYPIYFTAFGTTYNYSFSIWRDRVSIGVHNREDLPEQSLRDKLRSTMYPATEAELRCALQTVVNDRRPLRPS